MARTRKNISIPLPGPRACHPKVGHSDTCLPTESLYQVGSALGAPSNLEQPNLKKWIKNKTRCKTERCWIEKAPIDEQLKKKLLKEYFRPTLPDEWLKKPTDWLDSNQINMVMKQYEETYPFFKYYGALPIDFSAPDPYDKDAAKQNKCLEDAVCKINLKELLNQGIKMLGFVYNLDPSNKGGSHWMAGFTDIPARRCYYFDSYGMKPPPQIARFMRSLTLQDPKMKLEFNHRRFQYGKSECGMYSMYFLIRMIGREPFKVFCRRAPSDKEMISLRKWMYSLKNE